MEAGGAPAKKKRTVDSGQVSKIKDDRRRRRLVKALRKMEKKPRQPKPIVELEVPPSLHMEAKLRQRNADVPEEVRSDDNLNF